MKIQGKQYNTIWLAEEELPKVAVIDQRKLPFQFEVKELETVEDTYFRHKRNGGARCAVNRRNSCLWHGTGTE